MIRISEYIFKFFNEPESDFYQTLRAIFGYPYKQSFYSPCIFRYISHKKHYFSEISVLSHNSAKLELTLSTKASIHCQTKGVNDGQKY